jgi:hypothetical protein
LNRIARRFAASSVVLLVALAGSVQAAIAATPPPAATAGGGVSLRPLHPDTATPSYFTLHLPSGASAHDEVVITNTSTQSVSLAVSAVDGLTGQTSGSVYANRQDAVREAGLWVTPEITSLTLAGNASRTVGFTVQVPKGASAGDHLAGIAVENTVPTSSGNGFSIKQILRSVIGVRVVVPGPAAFYPRLVSLDINGIGATGIGAVDIGLGNSGKQLAKPTLVVAMTGPAGYSRSLTRHLDTVLPGDTITYPFAWPDRLQKGSYDIKATLTGGGITVSLNKTVQLGTTLAGVTQPLPTVVHDKAKSNNSLVMLLAALLAVAIAAGLITAAVLRRGRKRAHEGRLN